MKRLFWACIGAAAAFSFTTASAADKQVGAFSCISTNEFELSSGSSDGVRIANFSINEQLSQYGKKSASLQISYAADNRLKADVWLTTEFLLLDGEDAPLAALTVSPPKMRVPGLKSAVASGWTMVDAGTLASSRYVCSRWYQQLVPPGL